MISANKSTMVVIALLCITACSDKKKEPILLKEEKQKTENPVVKKNNDYIEGIYKSSECEFSVEITKSATGYVYLLKTNARKVKGKANFSTNDSGEKYIVFEGIKWDEYEGDISNEDETDSIPRKEIEIPVGIDASYVKDTLTIQNYGNAMNYYTKISECGSKYIQLIKIPNR